MKDRFGGQVDIEVWPEEMVGGWPFDVAQGGDRCLSKPWELIE